MLQLKTLTVLCLPKFDSVLSALFRYTLNRIINYKVFPIYFMGILSMLVPNSCAQWV